MKNFLLDLINFIKFKKVDSLKVGFFCENKYIFEYIKPYINKKANNNFDKTNEFQKEELENIKEIIFTNFLELLILKKF